MLLVACTTTGLLLGDPFLLLELSVLVATKAGLATTVPATMVHLSYRLECRALPLHIQLPSKIAGATVVPELERTTIVVYCWSRSIAAGHRSSCLLLFCWSYNNCCNTVHFLFCYQLIFSSSFFLFFFLFLLFACMFIACGLLAWAY